MNLALNYCWKEWRAQRGLLTAYTLLVFACLCLALYLAPRHYWFEDDFGVHALSWFVGVGVIGVVAFVVPSLVRGEFTSKEDQFVRRLPNALLPSFFGKLLFLVLATVTLPLLGLLAGEAFVTSLDHGWDGLYGWNWDGTVFLKPPTLVIAVSGFALLLLPWIWAAGTWMPGGRLALLMTLLLVLVVSVLVFAVVRQSPKILVRFPWESWLWAVPVSGLLAAAASWCLGRRGGGALRSARFGLLATALTLLPGGVWLGQRAWFYHHPRVGQLNTLQVRGITADERFVLASVSEQDDWQHITVRIDLHTGETQQPHGSDSGLLPGVDGPNVGFYQRQRGRFWHQWTEDGRVEVFDLATCVGEVFDYDKERRMVQLPEMLREEVRLDCIANTRLRGPGNRPVWIEDGCVCMQRVDGAVSKSPWDTSDTSWVLTTGLGLKRLPGNELFDLVKGRIVDARDTREEHFVGESLVFQRRKDSTSKWFVRQGDQPAVPCDALSGAQVLGLLDDARLIACHTSSQRRERPRGPALPGRPGRLFLFAPDSGVVTELDLPSDLPFEDVRRAAPLGLGGSLLARDPEGCVWLTCRADSGACFVRLDTTSLQVTSVLRHRRDSWGNLRELLSWRELPYVVVKDGLEIVRIHIDTGERSVLFPLAHRPL
jgi:hypothetical protein